MLADLAIRGALVIDGSGAPAYEADVEVRQDRITRVGTAGPARREIDGRGHVLAPGFVDVHTHDDAALLRDPALACKLLQGCTSVVVGNCGFSLAPGGKGAAEPPGNASLFCGLHPAWSDLSGYLSELTAVKPAVNAMALVGHNAIRCLVMGQDERSPTQGELGRMRDLLTQSLEQGASGFSTGLIYRPGRSSTTDEIIEIARPLSAFGAVYATHMRSESDALTEAVEEALRIGREVGCPVQISHHKAAGRKNWGRVAHSRARIDAANVDGIDVAFDVYPYAAGSGPMIEHFDLDAIDLELASVIRVSSCPSFPEYEGHMLPELAIRLGLGVDALVRQILTAPGGDRTLCITFTMSEMDVEANLRHPRSMIGSDGLPSLEGRPHPRLFGAFPRVIAEYVRKRGAFTLEQAVRKMTSMGCDRFGLAGRGLVREGFFADLVLFEPDGIADRATYDEPELPPVGIHLVIVNGEIAAEGGRLTGARSGRALRFRAAD